MNRSALKFAASLVLLVMALGEQATYGQSSVSQGSEKSESGSPALPVQVILGVLARAHVSGSLQFNGSCSSLDYPRFPEFPHVSISANPTSDTLDTLRKLFVEDHLMQIAQDSKHVIRMTERGVPADILEFKIRHVSFDNEQGGIYNANAALNFILESPDLKHYMTAHKIGFPFEGGPISALYGSKPVAIELPHIHGVLDNVSIGDAMDEILKVFPGLWIYESCPATVQRQRVVYFRFYGLPDNLY